jgi:hypothetical protein
MPERKEILDLVMALYFSSCHDILLPLTTFRTATSHHLLNDIRIMFIVEGLLVPLRDITDVIAIKYQLSLTRLFGDFYFVGGCCSSFFELGAKFSYSGET